MSSVARDDLRMAQHAKPSLTVEFYGIPRERAGRTELTAPAGTLAEILSFVQVHCPRLHDLLLPESTLSPQYRVSLDGARFLTDLHEELPRNSHLLILSADPG